MTCEKAESNYVPTCPDAQIRILFSIPNTASNAQVSERNKEMYQSCKVMSLDHAVIYCSIIVITCIDYQVSICSAQKACVMNGKKLRFKRASSVARRFQVK